MGWTAYLTADSNQTYYHHSVTGETTWIRPEGMAIDETAIHNTLAASTTDMDFQQSPLHMSHHSTSSLPPPLPTHAPQPSISRAFHSQKHSRHISSAVIPIGHASHPSHTSFHHQHTQSRAPLAYIETGGMSTDAAVLNKYNTPQPIWKRHPRRIGVVMFSLLMLLAITGVVLYFFVFRHNSNTPASSPEQAAAAKALESSATQYYDPNTATLTLPTYTSWNKSDIFGSVQQSLLSKLFGSGSSVNGTNNIIPSLILSQVKPITNILSGWLRDPSSLNTLTSFLPQLSTLPLPDALLSLLSQTISQKAWTGKLNLPVGSVGEKLLGLKEVECTFVTFFAPFEKNFTTDSIHYALHCELSTSWDEQRLLGNSSLSTWFSELRITTNASILISTLSHEELKNQTVVPMYIDRGVTIFADVIPSVMIAPNTILGGINTLLLHDFARGHVQISFPMSDNAELTDWASTLTAVRGKLWIDEGILAASDASIVSTKGISIELIGQQSKLASVSLAAHVTASIQRGSISNEITVVGDWRNDILQLTGKMSGTWSPLAKATITRDVAVLSNLDISLVLTTYNNSVQFVSASYTGDATFSYGSINVNAQSAGSFTSQHFMIVVAATSTGDLPGLVRSLGGGQSLDLLTSNVLLSASGTLDIAISTYQHPIFSTILGKTLAPGLSLNIHGQILNTASPTVGVIGQTLSQLSNTTTVTSSFDVVLTLPLSYDGTTLDGASTQLGITAKNIILGPVTLSTFNFALTMINGKPQIAMEGSLVYPLPGRTQPLVIGVNVTYATSNGIPHFIFIGAVDSLQLNVFGTSWLHLDNTRFILDVTTTSKQDVHVAFTTQASFAFPGTISGTPITLGVEIDNRIVTLYARNIRLSSIHPRLADIGGIGTQPWDLVLTTATGSPKISFNPASHPVHTMTAHHFHTMNTLTPTYVPQTITSGLNLYTSLISLKDHSWGKLMDTLQDVTYANHLFNVTLHLPFSLQQKWKARIVTSQDLKFSPVVTLNQASLDIDVIPTPLSIGAGIGATATFTIPHTTPMKLAVAGTYQSTQNQLTLAGQLGAIDNAFGQSWLKIHPSTLQFSMISTSTKVGSFASGATFFDTAEVDVCAWVGAPTSAITVHAGIKSLPAALCRIFNLCGPSATSTGNAILDTLGLTDLQLAAYLTSAEIDPGMVTGTMCNMTYKVPMGVTLASNVIITGDALNKLKGFFGEKLTQFINGWLLSLNLPFSIPSLTRHRARLAAYHANPESANINHPTLRHLTPEQHRQRMASLALLDGLNRFSVNYQKDDLTIRVNNWLMITGLGLIISPSAIPSPLFSIYTAATVTLPNQEPLLFRVAGTVSGVGVTLEGSMITAGWKNPFGIKGLIVYGAGIRIGFGAPTGVTALGMAFQVQLGDRILVGFDGSLAIDNLSKSYLQGGITSLDNKPLALRDFILAVRTMAGNNNNNLGIADSILPGPGLLSLTNAQFSIAAQDTKGLLGQTIKAGITFALEANLFGIQVKTSGGTREANLLGFATPITDIYFNFALSLDAWNTGIFEWLRARISFLADVLKDASFCAIACVKSIAIDELSILGWTKGEFPTIRIVISILGSEFTFDTKKLTQSLLQTATNPVGFFEIFDLKQKFACIDDDNCGQGQFCNHFKLPFQCQAGCPNGQTLVPKVGCVIGSWTKEQCPEGQVWIPVLGCKKKFNLFGAFGDVIQKLPEAPWLNDTDIAQAMYQGQYFDVREAQILPEPVGRIEPEWATAVPPTDQP